MANQLEFIIESIQNGDWVMVLVGILEFAGMVVWLYNTCFTGDTLVATEDGSRRIDQIKVGDKVWAYNPDTGEKELKEVVNVFVKETDEILHLETTDGTIDTTTTHPFYVVGEGWKAAGDLKAGDEIYSLDGTTVIITGANLEKLDETIKVYNLEVADFHTYFVGNTGMLVHNRCGVDDGFETGGKSKYHTPITHGTSEAPKKSIPNSIYEQLNPDGSVRSRTFYNENGDKFSRQDFNHSHFDKSTQQYYQPHEHNFSYNENGQPNGKFDGPLPPGYDNSPNY